MKTKPKVCAALMEHSDFSGLEVVDCFGRTALHYAARGGHEEVPDYQTCHVAPHVTKVQCVCVWGGGVCALQSRFVSFHCMSCDVHYRYFMHSSFLF